MAPGVEFSYGPGQGRMLVKMPTWKKITSLEELEESREEWISFWKKDGGGNIFCSYEWIVSWLENYGDNTPWFVLIGRGRDWKGIFPLYVSRHRYFGIGFKAVTYIGVPQSDRCGMLVRGNSLSAARDLFEVLKEHLRGRWCMDLPEIDRDCPFGVALMEAGDGPSGYKFCREQGVAPFIRIGGSLEDFYKTLSKNFRKQIKKSLKRTREKGDVTLIPVAYTPENFRLIKGLARRSHKWENGTSLFLDEESERFLEKLLPRLQNAGMLKIVLLYLRDEPVAYDIFFKAGRVLGSYEGAYDDKFSEISPGHLSLQLLVEDAIATDIEEIDLLRGQEEYKFRWTSHFRHHWRVVATPYRIIRRLYFLRFKLGPLVRVWLVSVKGFFKRFQAVLLRHRIMFDQDTQNYPGGYSIRVFRDISEILELKKDWMELFDRCDTATIFMSYEWVISWLEVFGDQGEPVVIAVYRKNQLAGLAPYFLSRRKFLFWRPRTLGFIGFPFSDCCNFILMDLEDEKVIELVIEYLWQRRSLWSLIKLEELQENSFELFMATGVLPRLGILYDSRVSDNAPFLALDNTWKEYLSARTKKFRKNMRLNFNRAGGSDNTELVTIPYGEEAWRVIEEISFKSKKFGEGLTFMADPQSRDFFSRVLNLFNQNGWLRIEAVKIAGKISAYLVCFDYQEKLLLYDEGYDPDDLQAGPGHLLLYLLIEQSISAGVKEIDFLRGGHGFKFRYTNEFRVQKSMYIYSSGLYATMLRLAFLASEIFKFIRRRHKPHKLH